ncbi:N-acetylmuramoyl-L-alanine amidase [Paracoccus sp. (in: a-proteobacteria)]|uniref:N-acetylmuramoyl-L-alanine amidase n=1 Tax=Paracoccus sp. TaxID=267 RepID=UPI0032203587
MIRLCALVLLLFAAPARAQQDALPAQLDLTQSVLLAEGRDRGRPRPLELRLALGRAVPYRVYFLAEPPRLVVDFRGLELADSAHAALAGRDLVPALRWGRFRPGWSRLVMELPGPYALVSAEQTRGDAGALLALRIEPTGAEGFVTRGDALAALRDLPRPEALAPAPQRRQGGRALRVALDPGHGGHDPGALVGAISEAAVMRGFARELAEELTRAGHEVVLTRDDDSFIPLERRMTLARSGGADLFISLHADALPAGGAAGLSIHVWNPHADDRATRELAARHDRDDLLAGLDLAGTDNQVAGALMDLARTETQPRSEAFAKFAVSELNRAGIVMHSRPVRGAAFSVLKSPDIPSVLVELGFLTDAGDRANLFDPEWRRRTALAITRAVGAWAEDDVVRASLARK